MLQLCVEESAEVKGVSLSVCCARTMHLRLHTTVFFPCHGNRSTHGNSFSIGLLIVVYAVLGTSWAPTNRLFDQQVSQTEYLFHNHLKEMTTQVLDTMPASGQQTMPVTAANEGSDNTCSIAALQRPL